MVTEEIPILRPAAGKESCCGGRAEGLLPKWWWFGVRCALSVPAAQDHFPSRTITLFFGTPCSLPQGSVLHLNC